MTLAHCHPFQSDLLSLRLSLVLQGRLLLEQVGHWAQPRCLQLELGLELKLQHLPCPLGELGQRQWLQQWWYRSEGL